MLTPTIPSPPNDRPLCSRSFGTQFERSRELRSISASLSLLSRMRWRVRNSATWTSVDMMETDQAEQAENSSELSRCRDFIQSPCSHCHPNLLTKSSTMSGCGCQVATQNSGPVWHPDDQAKPSPTKPNSKTDLCRLDILKRIEATSRRQPKNT